MNNEKEQLIYRILAGKATSDEEIKLIEWLSEESKNQELFASHEKLWSAIEIVLNRNKYNHEKVFHDFRSRIKSRSKGNIFKSGHPVSLLTNSLRWAVIGLLLIGIGGIVSYLALINPHNKQLHTYEVTSPLGSRSNILLPDSTSIWLNADSKISFSSEFGNKERMVFLKGEGYFTVTENALAPFIVVTPELEITALGTSFNVKSYPEEGIIQTTLVSGSLLITRSMYKETEKGVILEPNQQITYYTESKQMLITYENDDKAKESELVPENVVSSVRPAIPMLTMRRGVDPEVFTSWKDNRLIFDNEPFESIAIKLERRFGARIIIEDENIKNKKFKGRFEEVTIEQALTALKFASPFEFYIKEDTIFITSQQ